MRCILLSILLLVLAPSFAFSQKDQLCGVDLGKSDKCFDELKQLPAACKENPIVCGVSLLSNPSISLEKIKYSCKHMWKTKRKKWIKSLCGAMLYSRPSTFCGDKGIEVAHRCSLRFTKRKTQSKPEKKVLPPPNAKVELLPPQQKKKKVALVSPPEDKKNDLKNESFKRKVFPENTTEDPKVGGLSPLVPKDKVSVSNLPAQPKPQERSWLLYFILSLQLLILFYLFRKKEKPQEKISNPSFKNTTSGNWGAYNTSTVEASNDLVEKIEPKIEVWTRNLSHSISELQKTPLDELQNQADAIYQHYLELSQLFSKQISGEKQTSLQTHLVKSKERLDWVFHAHRTPSPSITNLHLRLRQRMNELIQEMGGELSNEVLEKEMKAETTSCFDFLSHKRKEQVFDLLQEKPLQSFGEICREFLQTLDTSYQQNLLQLKDKIVADSNISPEIQENLFKDVFLQDFLLTEIPMELEHLLRQSNVNSIGPFVDQILHFIQECLEIVGWEFVPSSQAVEEASPSVKVDFLFQAGIRDSEGNYIRKPSANYEVETSLVVENKPATRTLDKTEETIEATSLEELEELEDTLQRINENIEEGEENEEDFGFHPVSQEELEAELFQSSSPKRVRVVKDSSVEEDSNDIFLSSEQIPSSDDITKDFVGVMDSIPPHKNVTREYKSHKDLDQKQKE